MTYSQAFAKVTYVFTLLNAPDEIADTSLNFGDLAGPFDAPGIADALYANAEDIFTDFQALINDSALNHSSYSGLAQLRFAAIDTAGHYIDDVRTWEPAGITRGSAGQTKPQLTVVASLRAGSSLGAGKKGRMYLPHTQLTQASASPQGTGMATVADLVAAHVSLLNTFADAGVSGARAVIMGQTGGGTVETVASVRVGSVTDTQRRRRNRIPETYTSADVS